MKSGFRKIANQIFPKSLKNKISEYCTELMKENQCQKFLRREKEISAYELDQIHLANFIAVPNRMEFFANCQKQA